MPTQAGQHTHVEMAGSISEVTLLKKSRVTHHGDGEHMFRIFYQLLGASEEKQAEIWPGLKGRNEESFPYFGSSRVAKPQYYGVPGNGCKFSNTVEDLELSVSRASRI